IKLPTHKHPLYPTPWVSRCKGCPRRGGYVKDGYRCYECAISFHKECAEAILEIHHPSHHAHPLSLVFKRRGPKNCKLCGVYLYNSKYYQCSICDFVVHTACAKNPPPMLLNIPKPMNTLLLSQRIFLISNGSYRYRCSPCRLEFEIGCSMLALEIDYPYHPKHPLKFLTKEEHHFSDGKCLICGEELGLKFYHCSICKFSVDVSCVRDPPPLTVLFPKAHEHQLSLTPRKISFDCDACGMAGDRSPYSCQQCYFMIHQICIDLPEIINVNRHEHRLSRRLHLSPESWVCGFCHKNVDWSYGAYSCSICPNYVIHSKCAIRDDVWDKLELKGIPENLKISNHLSHKEHYLQLNEEGIISGGSIRCEACVLPIYSQAFYSCYTDFQYFSIDVKCAMLSESIIHESHPCTLYYNNNTYMECASCNKRDCQFYEATSSRKTVASRFELAAAAVASVFLGLSLENKSLGLVLENQCATISESIIHESHPLTLYYNIGKCDDCSFVLDRTCAALPKTTQHWYDEHLLFLCYEKNKRGNVGVIFARNN
ncbi:hypothetical protein HID58_044839, partial [Brassica napus]